MKFIYAAAIIPQNAKNIDEIKIHTKTIKGEDEKEIIFNGALSIPADYKILTYNIKQLYVRSNGIEILEANKENIKGAIPYGATISKVSEMFGVSRCITSPFFNKLKKEIEDEKK